MPATLVPTKDIPHLADQVDSPAMLKVLRRLKERGFVQNGAEANPETADVLKRLTDLGLVDAAYAAAPTGKPFVWVSNSNGERVLKHFESKFRDTVAMGSRARTALAALSDDDRESVLATMQWLVLHDQSEWPGDQVIQSTEGAPVYLLRVTADLRAFIRVAPAAEIELFDLVREETLSLFRGRQAGTPQ